MAEKFKKFDGTEGGNEPGGERSSKKQFLFPHHDKLPKEPKPKGAYPDGSTTTRLDRGADLKPQPSRPMSGATEHNEKHITSQDLAASGRQIRGR